MTYGRPARRGVTDSVRPSAVPPAAEKVGHEGRRGRCQFCGREIREGHGFCSENCRVMEAEYQRFLDENHSAYA
jgi:hypothetical protein